MYKEFLPWERGGVLNCIELDGPLYTPLTGIAVF